MNTAKRTYLRELCTVLAVLALPLLLSSAAWAEQQWAVGLMSDMTGSLAPNGEDCRNGYRIAIESFGPQDRVRFLFADSRGDGKTAVSEFQRLQEQGIIALITNRSQVGMAINPLSSRSAIPLIGIVGHNDFVRNNPYALRMFPGVQVEAQALAEKATSLGLRKVAVITLEDEWLSSLTQEFNIALKQRGGQVLLNASVLPSELDFGALIGKIKDADAVFMNLGIAQSGPFLRRLRELGVKSQVLSNFWGAKKEVLDETGPEAAEGLIFFETDLRQPKFIAEHRRLFGHDRASVVTYSCYAGLRLLLNTVSSANTSVSKASLQQLLTGANAVVLLDETIPIVNREAIYGLRCRQIARGDLTACDSQ